MSKQETDLKDFVNTLQKMVSLLNNDVKSRITNCEHVKQSKHVECKKVSHYANWLPHLHWLSIDK